MRVFVYEYLSGGGCARIASSDAGLAMQGRAMRDALVSDLATIDGVATTYATIGPPASVVGARAISAEPGEPAPDFVRRQAREHDFVWVVAPESDGILADLHGAVGDSQWIGCRPEAIAIASSKRATALRLRCSGIPTTREDVLPFEPMIDRVGRWIVKPDDGAGAVDTRVHSTYADACADRRARAARGLVAILEAWEDGEPLSLSLLCGEPSVDVLSVNRQHIDVGGDGQVHYLGVSVNVGVRDAVRRALGQLAQRVVQALPGLAGYVGIDIVLRGDGVPVVIEVNPRLTCSYVGLSASLGRNVAREVLSRCTTRALHATL
jgi:tyramine---L-glutamate ligase